MSSTVSKTFSSKALLGVLAVVCMLVVGAFLGSYPPKAKAASPDWNGRTEVMVSQSQQTTGNALIVSALAASGTVPAARVSVKAVVMTGATAGIYTFFDGSTPSGAHQIGQFYLAANTPLVLTVESFRNGMRTSLGAPLYCVGPGILTYTLIFFEDTSG